MDKKTLDEFNKIESALEAMGKKMDAFQKRLDAHIANGRDARQRDAAKYRQPNRQVP